MPASAPVRPAACGVATDHVLLAPALDLVCKHPEHFTPSSCQGRAKLTLINCGNKPIALKQMTLTDGSRTVIFEFGPALIPPGGSRERKHHLMHAGRFTITTKLGTTQPSAGPTAVLHVRNPALEAARTRCKAKVCNGDFIQRGMLGILSCNCRMPNAGKPCTSGDQCEGKCVSTPKGFRCSKYRTVFGCHSYLPRGWKPRKASPNGIGRRVPSICTD